MENIVEINDKFDINPIPRTNEAATQIVKDYVEALGDVLLYQQELQNV